MRRRDRWREFLARVLPWFDQASWDRERRQTRQAIDAADRVRFDDTVRTAYGEYADRFRR